MMKWYDDNKNKFNSNKIIWTKKQEKGHYYFSNGDEYIGPFLNSYFHGSGTYIMSNGDKYEGDFVDGYAKINLKFYF